MRLWPRTLGMQLVIVTSVAVFLSNAAVALWFEMGSERLNESALTERLLDRAASVATLMRCRPLEASFSAAPRIARLLLSVAPLVKIISLAVAPMSRAICSRAASTACSASHPKE